MKEMPSFGQNLGGGMSDAMAGVMKDKGVLFPHKNKNMNKAMSDKNADAATLEWDSEDPNQKLIP